MRDTHTLWYSQDWLLTPFGTHSHIHAATSLPFASCAFPVLSRPLTGCTSVDVRAEPRSRSRFRQRRLPVTDNAWLDIAHWQADDFLAKRSFWRCSSRTSRTSPTSPTSPTQVHTTIGSSSSCLHFIFLAKKLWFSSFFLSISPVASLEVKNSLPSWSRRENTYHDWIRCTMMVKKK